MRKLLLILPVIGLMGCAKMGLDVPKTAVDVKTKDGKTCLIISVETCLDNQKFKEAVIDKCPVKIDY